MSKSIRISQKDMDRMTSMAKSQSFNRFVIMKGIFFFHNDKPRSKDGVNHKMIALYKKLRAEKKVYKFCCCYPGYTGLPMTECLVQVKDLCLGPTYRRIGRSDEYWMRVVSIPEDLLTNVDHKNG